MSQIAVESSPANPASLHLPRPNCFIAGGIRCGTTWLHAALADHPQICVSQIEKEIEFFGPHFHRGESWYRSFFPAKTAARWVVDASPAYLDGPDVADRIHAYDPGARLIFLLRDPVQRAYSDYCRRLNHGDLGFDLSAELHPDSALVRHGFYARHLREYGRRFRREQMLILLYDELVRDPRAFLNRVLEFLEVSTDHTPANLSVRTNETKPLKRWPLLHELLRQGYHSLLHVPMIGSLAFRLRSQNAFSFYHRLNRSTELDYPPFTEELQRRLADLYRDDVDALAEWLGVDLSHWLQVRDPAAS